MKQGTGTEVPESLRCGKFLNVIFLAPTLLRSEHFDRLKAARSSQSHSTNIRGVNFRRNDRDRVHALELYMIDSKEEVETFNLVERREADAFALD
jgi:hypothetical protein